MPVPVHRSGDRFISSPLGLVPKSGVTNSKSALIEAWLQIHQFSFALKRSVNGHIPSGWGALGCRFFDDAVVMAVAAHRVAILIERDLADAFRHILAATRDYQLQGFF